MSVNIGGMSHSFGYYCFSHTGQKTFIVSVAEAEQQYLQNWSIPSKLFKFIRSIAILYNEGRQY